MTESDLTIVILAAGLGTRMKSAKAKVLHAAGGKTLIEHVVDTALELTQPARVFVVVGHQAGKVRSILETRGVGFIEQTEQKGTGHALMAGREALQGLPGRLVVLYGDCPLISAHTLRRLVQAQAESGSAATLITTLLEDPAGYGRVIEDESGLVRIIVEEKAATSVQRQVKQINSGIYCFSAAEFWANLGRIGTANPAGEYYLTDIVEILSQAGHAVRPMKIADPVEVLGINNRLELAKADALFRRRKAEELMLGGVTIEKPETVSIDGGVRIGMDTIVEPFAQILGATSIGEDCVIGACSIVRDSRLGRGVIVSPFTSIAGSEIDDEGQVGPYARLRMGAHVEAGAHVGNFVELKKTRLGPGSKAMHLAYLGDSDIGRKVNIGAGTITCNFDGVRKHATHIGDGAFVGSNSTIVAPMEIGADSYLAAGSVITHAVPPEALAIGRSRQVNKEGWARKRKKASHP
ncbi:MAG TPA: bifunctional UDP-N-acetylglucosamine diphosphorylase/glucosamine-1-phosphate N-acetyltransferase GlmU [Bryobacteraceae bacterium]|jgi:bifunctional UDP-N-acetylglucosamine pyrophosphorylase/glucosamine-1-phosphate N-acetyltransferase|nr:bifunctional UDP-N-acetylglucosamine diphosphorylase/glucosamine-1-phosphate N-acetyltransferase GlmU [Bryobacteraceae bacterium]